MHLRHDGIECTTLVECVKSTSRALEKVDFRLMDFSYYTVTNSRQHVDPMLSPVSLVPYTTNLTPYASVGDFYLTSSSAQ